MRAQLKLPPKEPPSWAGVEKLMSLLLYVVFIYLFSWCNILPWRNKYGFYLLSRRGMNEGVTPDKTKPVEPPLDG